MKKHPFLVALLLFCGSHLAVTAQSLTWEPLGPASGVYGGLCIDSGGTIYAYKWEGGIVRSTDMGASWTLVAPYVSGSLVAAGRDTVYHLDDQAVLRRTTDAGRTWRVLSDRIWSMTVGADGRLYGTRGRYYSTPTTLFEFSAAGAPTAIDGPKPTAMALIGSSASGALFGLGADSLFRSDDRGVTWRSVMTGVDDMYEFFGTGPAGRLYLVNDESKVFRSSDDGVTWTKTGEITGRTGIVMGTAIDDSGAIHIGQGDRKFMRSTDEGATWSVMSQATVTTLLRIPGGLLGGLLSQRMSITTDGGATWRASGTGLPGEPITSVVATSDTAAIAWIDAQVRMTMRAGDSLHWRDPVRMTAADFARSSDGRVFAFDYNTRRVYRTSDEGTTWDSSASTQAFFGALLSVDRQGRLVAAGAGLFRSTDLGDTWLALDTSTAEYLSAVAIDSSGRIIAGRGRELAWYDEANGQWEPFTSFPTLTYGVTRIVVMRDGTLFVLAWREGLYRSLDAGATWTLVRAGQGTDIAVSRSGLLVVADDDLIYASHDRGTTLFEIGRDLGFGAMSLSISPGGRIFVGTRFGLFRAAEPVLSAPRDERNAQLAALHLVPNPASDHAELTYLLDRRAHVRITIVDAAGRERLRVLDETRDAGAGRVRLELGDLSDGAYFVRMEAGETRTTRALVKR